jgi:hypothetical protein
LSADGTGTKRTTCTTDLGHQDERSGNDDSMQPIEADGSMRRTAVSACGRSGAREHEQETPGCSSLACGAPEGLLGDGEAMDGGSRAAAQLGFGGGMAAARN